jgi:hypothetical protein
MGCRTSPAHLLTVLLITLLPLEFVESNLPEEPRWTKEEINDWLRDYIGLTSENRTRGQTVDVESQSPSDWTGQPFPVGSLMQTAVAAPASFCKLLTATIPRPTKRRRPPAGGAARGLNREEPERPADPMMPVHTGRSPRVLRKQIPATISGKSPF